MTSADPSLEPTIPTDPKILARARSAGLVAAELLAEPGVVSVAVLRAHEAPAVAVRVMTLDVAAALAAYYDLTWHTQACARRDAPGALWVHAYEGALDAFPVTVYATGGRDWDPDVGELTGPCAVPLVLAGLIL